MNSIAGIIAESELKSTHSVTQNISSLYFTILLQSVQWMSKEFLHGLSFNYPLVAGSTLKVETGIDSKKLIAFASEILEEVKDENWTGEESKENVTV